MPDDASQGLEFTATYDDASVADLRARLSRTRWVDEPATSDALGIDLTYLRELLSYWEHGYDFDAHRRRLASHPSRHVTINGLGIHVVHALAREPRAAIPLLLAHGWPDSSWRYRRVISPLTSADQGAPGDPVFDLVIPDMPGFGFSDSPTGDTLNSREVAGMWAELMTTLGYERFAVAGGDIGSHVARYLALDHPDRVLWVHRMDAGLPVFDGDPATLTQEERDWFADTAAWGSAEGAYAAMHTTKPQTVATALTDSPAGMAAWILEKLLSWRDCPTGIESIYTREDILDLLTEYWVTRTIGSSMRMYRANAAIPRTQHARHVDVPSGFSIFAGDITQPPHAWLERTANTIYAARPAHGGHFAPYEQPNSYAREIRNLAQAASSQRSTTSI